MTGPPERSPVVPPERLFVGRGRELSVLCAQLAAARSGSARTVRLSGDPGVGKTALARALLDQADGFRVLTCTGEQSESSLAYGVLDQLLGALGSPSATTTAATPLSAGAQLIRVLSDAQADGPLLLWVDDLHWADLPSQQALLFALRRLEADTVLVLLCVRSGEAASLLPGLARLADDRRCTDLDLPGLELSDLAELAEAMVQTLPQGSLQRLHQHTGGNPLWTTALLRELPADQLLDRTTSLPAPRSFAALTMDRLQAIGADCRALVEASAAAGAESPLGALSTAGGVENPLEALAEAAEAGLLVHIRTTPPRVRTEHALVSSAVYGSLDGGRRARLHSALAEVAETEHERLRHEVAASPGYDADLAARLAALGRQQGGQGAWVTAADTFHTAADLTGPSEERSALVAEAAGAALMGGDVRRAAPLCAELATLPATARTTSLLGWLAYADGRHADAERLLLAVTELEAPLGDLLVAADASRLLGYLYVLHGRADESVAHARRAVELSAPTSPEQGSAWGALGLALGTSGQPEQAVQELGFVDDKQLPPGHLPALTARGVAKLWAGDVSGCIQDLSRAAAASASCGASEFGCAAHGQLANAYHLSGDWDASIDHGERAVGVVEDGDLGWALAAVHAHAVASHARRGLVEPAEQHVLAAVRAAERTGETMSIAYAGTAAAVAAHSRHDFAGVLLAVAPVLALEHRVGVDEPGNLEWPALYVEALVRQRDVAEADRALSGFEPAASAAGRPWPLASAARVRGLVDFAQGRATMRSPRSNGRRCTLARRAPPSSWPSSTSSTARPCAGSAGDGPRPRR